MCEFALLMLTIHEYARILDVSYVVHRIRPLYKLLSSYQSRQRHIQSTVEHLRWSVLQKEWCLSAGVQPEVFKAGEVSWNCTSINSLSKT